MSQLYNNKELSRHIDRVVAAYLSMGEFAAMLLRAKEQEGPDEQLGRAMASTALFTAQLGKLNLRLKQMSEHFNDR